MSEAELLEAARRGDQGALDELFRRHYDGAVRFAERFAGSHSADDRAAEGFARVYRALQQGHGPETNFRAYLYTAVRNAHIDALRKFGSELPVEGIGVELPAADDVEEAVLDAMDGTPITRAFAQLNPTWRTVLWRTVVLGESHAAVAARMGSNINAIGVLTYRAREGLRQAYLAEHVRASPDPRCREVAARLPRYIRGHVPAKAAREIEAHLADCPHCQAAVRDLTAINQDLRAIVTPALVVLLPAAGSLPHALSAEHAGTLPTAAKVAIASLGAAAGAVAVAMALSGDHHPRPDPVPTSYVDATSTASRPASPLTTVTPPAVRRSTSPSVSPSGEPSVAEPPTPTSSPPSSTPADSPPPAAPPPSTPAPVPRVGEPRVVVSGSDQARSASVMVEITPAGGGSVVVTLSNAADPEVSGAGVRCSPPEAHGAASELRCAVRGETSFVLTVQAGFADPTAPLQGSIGLEGTDAPTSTSFVADP